MQQTQTLDRSELIQKNLGVKVIARPVVGELGTIDQDQLNRTLTQSMNQVIEQFQCRSINPVQIFNRNDKWPLFPDMLK